MIKENAIRVLAELPDDVSLVAATKARSADEIRQAIEAGVKVIGENYVQEAKDKFAVLGDKVKWHFIGHLQKNKVKHAVIFFDLIETLDSFDLAVNLNKECEKINKIMPVLIEINSASEPQKNGVLTENAEQFLEKILQFTNLKPSGLMTMGPWLDDPENLRPYFAKTKGLFDKIKARYSKELDWKYLSMGMSSSYKISIEEGANIIRVGTAIFGARNPKPK